MYKHGSYVIIMIITWTIELLVHYYILFRNLEDEHMEDDKQWIRTLSHAAMYNTGTCLALVRLMDTFNWNIIKNYVKELYGYVEKKAVSGKELKPINFYLNQSLNLELIYIILTSISKFSKSSDFFFDDDYKLYEQNNNLNFYDTKHYLLRKVNLDRVEISNKWKVEESLIQTPSTCMQRLS